MAESRPLIKGITLKIKKHGQPGIKKADQRGWDLYVFPEVLQFATRDNQNFKVIPRSQIQVCKNTSACRARYRATLFVCRPAGSTTSYGPRLVLHGLAGSFHAVLL
jgi:hypothetical protein